MKKNGRREERAASVTHAEYEILNHLVTEIDLVRLKRMMCDDKVSKDRFTKAGGNVLELIENMMGRRRHKLPKHHPDYKEKVA
jgi:hypothetical protein